MSAEATTIEVVTFLVLSLLRRKVPLLVVLLALGVPFIPYKDSDIPLQRALPLTMKASVYDGEKGFKVITTPLPTFQTTLAKDIMLLEKTPQALVKIKAVSLNPIDYKLTLPLFPIVRWLFPNAVARDFSGTVVQTSSNKCKVKVGDEIFGKSLGVLQEYAVVPCSSSYLKPKKVSFVQAAAVGVACGTSYDGLTKYGSIKDKRVLIVGGSGGTGSVAVSMANKMGANVTTICSGKNADFVKRLGAHHVLDYTSPNWKRELDALPAFDHIYDTVTSPNDPDYELLTRHKLVPTGTYVSINGSVKDFVVSLVSRFVGQNLQREKYDWLLPSFADDHFTQITKFMTDAQNPMQITIDETISDVTSETVQAAFEKLKSRRTKGKIVFTF